MSKRSAAALISCFMLLPMLFGSQLAAASGPVNPGAREKARHASGSAYDDEFNGTSLDPKWGWFNPPASFDVGNTTPGQLHIVSQPNTNFGPSATSGTILYQNMSGNFTLETKVSVDPVNGVEKVGIMIYGSDTVWASVKYQVDGGICVEVGVQDPSGFGNYGTTTVSGSPMWLRMVKSGTAFSTFYSTDGAQWNWVFDWNQSFDEPFKAGLMLSDGYANDNFSADFDYFHCILPDQPPEIMAPLLPVTFNEDEKFGLNVFDHFYDPDGDNLTFSVDAPHIRGRFNTAINDFQIFGLPNWCGSEQVLMTAEDSYGLSVQAPLNVTVLPVEDPPILNRTIPELKMYQNSTSSGPDLSKCFVDNDTPYGDRLAYDVYGFWALVVNITPDGKVTLTAPIDFWGVVNLTFTATDDANLTASGGCRVTILHVDQAPQVVRSNIPDLIVDEDSSVSMDFSPVFWDPDGDPVTLIPSGNVQIDVLQTIGSLVLTFRPKADASGFSETIKITAKDDSGLGDNFVLIKVTVIPVNDPPRVTRYSPVGDVVISENQSQYFNISAYDPESASELDYAWYLDGQPVTFGDPGYIYNPDFTSAGNHTVRVSVSDGELSVTRSWNVTVLNADRHPTDLKMVTPKAGDIYKEGNLIAFEGSANDPDGDALVFTWFEGYKVLGEGRTLSLVLPAGAHTVVLQVSDGIEEVDTSPLWFTVQANAPPKLFSLDPYNGQSFDKGARIHFKADAADTDGDALTFCWTDSGKLLSTSPEFNESGLSTGPHKIHLTISDGKTAIGTDLTFEIRQPPASASGPGPVWVIAGAGAAVAAAIIVAVVAVILLRRKKPPAVAETHNEESVADWGS